jgi:RNA polymerase sigma-70 factor, ECF subfamily
LQPAQSGRGQANLEPEGGPRVDHDAALLQLHWDVVERTIAHILGTDADAADVIQETFVAALGSLHGLREPASVRPWLASVAANTARRALRARARRQSSLRWFQSSEECAYEAAAPSVDVEARRALRDVDSVLARLSDEDRSVFMLRFVDGMELTELAAVCRVSLSTIKRRVARARSRFDSHSRNQNDLQHWLRQRTRSVGLTEK